MITLFFQSFANPQVEKYSAVIPALQTQDKLSSVQVTGCMLQEYEAQKPTNGRGTDIDKPDEGESTERALNMKYLKCWYCNKTGHKKSESRKRKADMKKKRKDGKFNG